MGIWRWKQKLEKLSTIQLLHLAPPVTMWLTSGITWTLFLTYRLLIQFNGLPMWMWKDEQKYIHTYASSLTVLSCKAKKIQSKHTKKKMCNHYCKPIPQANIFINDITITSKIFHDTATLNLLSKYTIFLPLLANTP